MKQDNTKKKPAKFLQKGKYGFLRVIFSRTGIILIMLAVQFALITAAWVWLNNAFVYVWVASIVLSVMLVVHIFNDESNPVVKLTWIIVITVIPVFGLMLYLFVKNDIGHRLMIKAYADTQKRTKKFVKPSCAVTDKEIDANPSFKGISRYLGCEGFSTYKNTRVTYFPLGEDKHKELIKRLKAAKKFIFLEYFIIEDGIMWDSILNILKEKANDGVEVRVMYDGSNTVQKLSYGYHKKLKKAGIKCKMFAPFKPFVSTYYNNRDHRKIAVIDGKVAFTGGINLADEYINEKQLYGHWKDTAVMLEGDGVIGFTLMFLQMWNLNEADESYGKYLTSYYSVPSDGYVIPYNDSPLDNDLVGENVYLDMINTAKDYVHITTPYLILDNEMISALTFAAKRGIDVTIIMPHIPDKKLIFDLSRSYYKRLLESGVKIYEYTPGFVHAKMFVSDGIKATVGTINLDFRSLYHHFECGVYMYGTGAEREIEKDFYDTLKKCEKITLSGLKKGKFIGKLVGKVLKLVAPLL